MASLRQIKQRGYMPNRLQIKLMMNGVSNMIKLLITFPGGIKKMREGQGHPTAKYKRYSRAYDLPRYEPEMKCQNSNEKYLRPTLYCDHTKPEVVALAHHLGAFKLSDKEYAENVFNFVKNNLHIEMVEFRDVDDTIIRGTGTCYHLISVFIALCRVAGIKARYKLFAMDMIESFYDTLIGSDPMIKRWYDSMGYFMLEGEGEAFIDGKWVVAHVGPTPERQAGAGIPITKFGEDSIGNWFFAKPGTVMYRESMPYGLNLMLKVGQKLAPGSMERFNLSIQSQHEAGIKVLKDYDSLEDYDAVARKKQLSQRPPEVKIKHKEQIVFEK